MKNRERFKDELADLALSDRCIAVTRMESLLIAGL